MAKFYWHIHHKILVEAVCGSIKDRIKFIKGHKIREEIGLRLKLMKPVRGKLPKAVTEAWKNCIRTSKAYDKAQKAHARLIRAPETYRESRKEIERAYEKTWADYDIARNKYNRVLANHKIEIEALHAKECPNCPWDGETIFPGE